MDEGEFCPKHSLLICCSSSSAVEAKQWHRKTLFSSISNFTRNHFKAALIGVCLNHQSKCRSITWLLPAAFRRMGTDAALLLRFSSAVRLMWPLAALQGSSQQASVMQRKGWFWFTHGFLYYFCWSWITASVSMHWPVFWCLMNSSHGASWVVFCGLACE